MVRLLIGLSTIVLSVSLAACRQAADPAAPPAAPAVETAPVSGRVLTNQLSVSSAPVPATLYEHYRDHSRMSMFGHYEGDWGASLYIPDSGWEKDPEEDRWTAADGGTAWFKVSPGGQIPTYTYAGLKAGLTALTFSDLDEWDCFTAVDQAEGTKVVARLLYDGATGWMFWGECPAEDEDLAAELEAMARTVEVGTLVRPERGEVDYFTEAQAATLYHGAGYTLYVPDQGWTVTADPDRRMVTWALAEREDATLSVRVWPGLGRATEEALYAAVRAETPDYPLVSEVPMTLRYVDHGEVLTVRFYQYGGDCYTITQHYPNESQVGYGSRVAAVAQTFLLFPGPAPGGTRP